MPKAELLGTFLEILSYGLYLILQIECLRVLWVKHRSGKPMHYLVGTSVAIFSLVTIHLAIDIVRVMNAFTTQMNVPDAPVLYYGKSNTSLSLTKTAVYVAVTLVSDILIVYRTFIIWDRRYLVAAGPFLLFLADIATSIWATWSLKEAKPGSNVLMADVTLRAKYFYAITLVLNCICTGKHFSPIFALYGLNDV
ncbi:hypothetical protein EW026_g7590 [Hermanssonia centrifuga]|uniref:Uncharacterized protein n=1 Tax=Hermanssonia centrifuga TaxID=98765 RepID=A0A4S4K7A5_9APHY|nr:hypothetical protein EW026_g7590 [Hermanssonia centrifuga]